MSRELIQPRGRRWLSGIFGSLLTVSCGSAADRPAPAPAVSVDLGAATEATPKPFLLDPRCPSLVAAVEKSFVDCDPTTFTRSALETPESRAKLDACAAAIDAASARVRDPNVHQAGVYAAWATRTLASVTQAPIPNGLGSGGDPALMLGRRQRAHALESVQEWCALERRQDVPESWVHEVEPVLAGLYPAFRRCAVDAQSRAPIDLAPGTELTLHWKALVDVSGKARGTSQVDFPSTMRADLALCILDVIDAATFPTPPRPARLGSNVTFVKGAD